MLYSFWYKIDCFSKEIFYTKCKHFQIILSLLITWNLLCKVICKHTLLVFTAYTTDNY